MFNGLWLSVKQEAEVLAERWEWESWSWDYAGGLGQSLWECERELTRNKTNENERTDDNHYLSKLQFSVKECQHFSNTNKNHWMGCEKLFLAANKIKILFMSCWYFYPPRWLTYVKSQWYICSPWKNVRNGENESACCIEKLLYSWKVKLMEINHII